MLTERNRVTLPLELTVNSTHLTTSFRVGISVSGDCYSGENGNDLSEMHPEPRRDEGKRRLETVDGSPRD